MGDPFLTGVDALRGIAPINYQWNEHSGLETNGTYVGFSAQNVQQFIPEAVGSNRSGMLTLSDRPILAAVINATNEQQAVFDELLGIGTTTPTSTMGLLAKAQPESLWTKIVDFFDGVVDGVLTIVGIKTETLCVGEVCVTEAEFRDVFGEGSQPDPTDEPESNATDASEEVATSTPDEPATGTSKNNATSTGSSLQDDSSQAPAESGADDGTESPSIDPNDGVPPQPATTSATSTPPSEPEAPAEEAATSTAESSAAETPAETATSTDSISTQPDPTDSAAEAATNDAAEPSSIDASDDLPQEPDDPKASTTTADAM